MEPKKCYTFMYSYNREKFTYNKYVNIHNGIAVDTVYEFSVSKQHILEFIMHFICFKYSRRNLANLINYISFHPGFKIYILYFFI